jgi:hypothetical protein
VTLQAIELERREDDLPGLSDGEFLVGVALVVALAAYAIWRFVRWSTRPPRNPRPRPASKLVDAKSPWPLAQLESLPPNRSARRMLA